MKLLLALIKNKAKVVPKKTQRENPLLDLLLALNKERYKMKKVSSEWIKEYNCKILDPDGWDRRNYDYSFNEEKITRKEFEKRLVFSTIQWKGELSKIRK